ncbi:hypothetical protein AOQ84DRAFT_390450 [Glonium stellatum]|uniref:Uncharacterized protein n=1 Tax=Glonium stellatum TaxID=574774 RepID=A0A8E2EWP2_9PEZI|nr:hypothetical protein AOQ84DRAFT_390450 [Glonium stellatum]
MAFLPSIKSLVQFAITGPSMLLGNSPSTSPPTSPPASQLQSPLEACVQPRLSCHASYGPINTCCTPAPGGQMALTQFWNSDASAGPAGYLGPNDTWTLHGLWYVRFPFYSSPCPQYRWTGGEEKSPISDRAVAIPISDP